MSARVSARRARTGGLVTISFIGSSWLLRRGASDAVGARHQLDRVQGPLRHGFVLRQELHPLDDMHPGERAFAGNEGLRIAQRLARDRPADLERGREIV